MFATVRFRLRALLKRRALHAELDEELRYHLEREAERNVASGMSPDDARFAARRAFGNPTVVAESSRDAMHFRLLDELRLDVAYALRAFRRAPTFLATVVVTIGLGLGLMTAAFTLFDAYVLRPVATRDPSSLYTLSARDGSLTDYFLSWPQVDAIREHRDVVDDALAYDGLTTRFRGAPVFGQLVSGNYFTMLGVPPAIGRTLIPSDSRTPGAEAVVVLSHDMWRSQFAGDSSVIGSTIALNGVRLRVVGVASKGFRGIESVTFDFWIPITMGSALDPTRDYFSEAARRGRGRGVRVIVRLHHGVNAEQAAAALTLTMRDFTKDRGPQWRRPTANLESHNGSMPITPETLAAIIPLAIAFGLVLLIACANVANIMLARGMARQREIGVRLALGASRARLIRQLLTESLLLSLPAAALSFVISRVTITLGIIAMYASMPTGYAAYLRPVALTPDGRLFAFVVIAAVVAAIGFSLAPAVQSTRPRIVHATRGDFDSNLRPSKLRSGLVVTQIGMSALLLVTAGVLLRAARNTDAIAPGMRTSGVVQMVITDASRTRTLELLRRASGVQSIASASRHPLDGVLRNVNVETSADSLRGAKFNAVSPEYFSILDIQVRRGRVFTSEEAAGRQKVVVVSQGAANQFWPTADPIGRRIRWALPSAPGDSAGAVLHEATVVGVVSNVSPGWIGLPREWPMLYFPRPLDAAQGVILARVPDAREAAVAKLEAALTRDDSAAVQDIHSMTGSLEVQRYPFHAAYSIAWALGLIAVLLTITGVYGVVAYLVAQRTREFGVRLALGATAGGIVRLVVRQSMRLAVAAVTVGALLALAMSRYLASQFTFVDAFSVAGYVTGIGTVLVACVVAAYVPSRRAATVNPIEALRSD